MGANTGAFRQLGGHIFHGVYGDIGTAIQQCFINLLGEKAFATDLSQWNVKNLITLGNDLYKLCGDIRIKSLQLCRDIFSLPEG